MQVSIDMHTKPEEWSLILFWKVGISHSDLMEMTMDYLIKVLWFQ